MDLNDYIIDHEGFDWATILEPWEHLLPEVCTVWIVNRFGEPTLMFDDGSVHLLDLELGAVKRLADSRDALGKLADDAQYARNWLQAAGTEAAEAAGMQLGPGQCYGYAQPLVLGGTGSVDNIRLKPIAEYYAFMAGLHGQIADIPDGGRVVVRQKGKKE